MSDVNMLVKDFLVESSKGLDQLECDLGILEKDPDDLQRLSSIYRVIHVMKGSCTYFGFSKLSFVTYVAENLVASLRNGQLRVDFEIRDALLAMARAVREILGAIGATGTEGDGDYTRLMELITQLQENSSKIARASLSDPEGRVGKPLARKRLVIPEALVPRSDSCSENPSGYPLPVFAAGGVRMESGHLNQLVNLVGELALARNQALFLTAREDHPAFMKITQRLNRVARELLGRPLRIQEPTTLANIPVLSKGIADPAAATTAEAGDHTHHAAAELKHLVVRFQEECLG